MEYLTIQITDDIPLTPSPSRCTFFPGFMDYVPGVSAQTRSPTERSVCAAAQVRVFPHSRKRLGYEKCRSIQVSNLVIRQILPFSNLTVNERNVVNITTRPDKKAEP